MAASDRRESPEAREPRAPRVRTRTTGRANRTLVAAGLALSAVIAVVGTSACNAILGIDKYSDGTGDLDGSNADSSNFDATTSDTSVTDGGTVDSYVPLPPGAQPETWARWRMPDRGADGAAPSYIAVSWTIVKDNVTNLTWQLQAIGLPQGVPTFADAKAACDALTDSGFTWRLPTRIELVSLLDHTFDGNGKLVVPAIGSNFISNTLPEKYWTASPVLPATEPVQFWLVDFGTGAPVPGTSASKVRCVRGS